MKRDARAIALLLIAAEILMLRLVSIPSFNFAFSDGEPISRLKS